MRHLLLTALALLIPLAVQAVEPPPLEREVEGQPLAANADRLRKALEFLGRQLPASLEKSLGAAIEKQDAVEIQKLLDPQVLAVVNINPEARVKVAAGPGSTVAQQAGYTPFLVKIVNESTVKKRLVLNSPQAGPVYSGAGRQAADPKADASVVKRFAQVELFQSPPMTRDLSGLRVEYAIGLIYSTEAGKREITLMFDVGQGTQDLGFRAELPVLFDIKPAIAVKMKVLDEHGKPTVGRFTFVDAVGHIYPPQAKRLTPDLFFQQQIYRADGGTVLLPPGDFTMTYGRGPEYDQKAQKVTVSANGPQVIEVRLRRWIDPAQYGYYSGDHHIHAAGCAHYTTPTEGIFPEDMFLHVKGEALNVGCCLTWGPCYDFQRKFFDSRPWERSEPFTILKYDVEVSGFGSQALGHVCLLNLRDQTYPGSEGTKVKGWPTWTTPLMRWAKEQGGVTGYAHSGNGLGINPESSTRRLFNGLDRGKKGHLNREDASVGNWPLPESFERVDANGDGKITEMELRLSTERTRNRLPNHIIPEMNGIGAQEICVTSAMGVCDFISAMDTDRICEWNCWYHIANCGFPLKVSGETDFPCITGSRVGQGRVYVQLGKVDLIDFGAWCKGIAAGKSYVSDGYAHCLDFQLDKAGIGETVVKPRGEKAAVKAKVAFQNEMPLGTAVGGKASADSTRKVELIVNGVVQQTKEVAADGKVRDVSFDVTFDKSSWVAIRSYPQMHTNPIYVTVDGKPIRASKESAKWCIGVIEQLWKVRQKDIRPEERGEAEKTFQKALAIYKQILLEAS